MMTDRKLVLLSLWMILILNLQGCSQKLSGAQENTVQESVQQSDQSKSGGLGEFVSAVAASADMRAFKGAIGGKYKIQMRLRRNGDALSGSYFYENKKIDIALKGTIDKRGNFTLTESDGSGRQTGVFKGKWKEESGDAATSLEGTWTGAKGGEGSPFYLVEQFVEFGGALKLVSKEIKEENKTRKYTVSAEYPQIEGSTDARYAKFNRDVEALITKQVNDYKKDAGRNPKEEDSMPGAGDDDLDISYNVALANDNLVSIEFGVSTYAHGAAHPQHNTMTLNYDLKSGRDLKLAELFKPGTKYLQAIASYSIKDLKRQGKKAGSESMLEDNDWIERGAAAEDENYKSWNITRKGLAITFDQYQVASYAAGPQTVVIPYTALKDILKPDGPVSTLSK